MAATEIIRAESPYYTTHEAAAYLKLSPSTLYLWRSRGSGPKFVLVMKEPRYRKSDLDAFVASCHERQNVSPNVGRKPTGKKLKK